MGGWEDIIYSKKGKARDTGQSRQEGKLSGNKEGHRYSTEVRMHPVLI